MFIPSSLADTYFDDVMTTEENNKAKRIVVDDKENVDNNTMMSIIQMTPDHTDDDWIEDVMMENKVISKSLKFSSSMEEQQPLLLPQDTVAFYQ